MLKKLFSFSIESCLLMPFVQQLNVNDFVDGEIKIQCTTVLFLTFLIEL